MICSSRFGTLKCLEDGSSFFSRIADALERLYTLKHHEGHRERHSLLRVISDFITRQRDDPRDKIYGLLGLLSYEESSMIQPN